MFEKGSQEDVAAACALLDDYSGALTSELHQRNSTTALLEGLISAQVILKPCLISQCSYALVVLDM